MQSWAGYNLNFPVLNIAVAVAVATACLPYLARGVQRLIEFVLGFAAVGRLRWSPGMA